MPGDVDCAVAGARFFFFFRVVSCAFTRGRSVPMTDFHSKNILHHLSLCIFHYGGDIASLLSTPTFCL